jgi:threonine/homoserine/homoserine lactone efflux protein
MLLTFLKGIGYGLVLAMLIGPVFFALIRTSIDKGFRSGAYLAAGIALSDSLVLFLMYFGVSQFASHPTFQTGLGLVGGGMMIAFGLMPFIKSRLQKRFTNAEIAETEHIINTPPGIRFVLEGLLLNMLNPFVYIFWIGTVGTLSVIIHQDYTDYDAFIFFLGTILTVFATDLSKVYVANQITNYLTAQVLSRIDKFAGIGLGAFGVRLLYFAVYGK